MDTLPGVFAPLTSETGEPLDHGAIVHPGLSREDARQEALDRARSDETDYYVLGRSRDDRHDSPLPPHISADMDLDSLTASEVLMRFEVLSRGEALHRVRTWEDADVCLDLVARSDGTGDDLEDPGDYQGRLAVFFGIEPDEDAF